MIIATSLSAALIPLAVLRSSVSSVGSPVLAVHELPGRASIALTLVLVEPANNVVLGAAAAVEEPAPAAAAAGNRDAAIKLSALADLSRSRARISSRDFPKTSSLSNPFEIALA